MTERILKSSISVLDAFNQVRNNQSLAHDTPTLNYHESILIFSHVANTIKFIQFIEDSIQEKEEEEPVVLPWNTDDLPS